MTFQTIRQRTNASVNLAVLLIYCYYYYYKCIINFEISVVPNRSVVYGVQNSFTTLKIEHNFFSFVCRFSLFYEPDEFYCNPTELNGRENGGVAVVRGHRVVKLDVEGRRAFLDNGLTISYDKCLIATGQYLINQWVFFLLSFMWFVISFLVIRIMLRLFSGSEILQSR